MKTHIIKQTFLYALLAFLLVGAVDPVMAQSTTSLATFGIASTTGTSSDATTTFGSLAQTLQNFAGILLVIGVIIGGILWMANKPQIAIGVLIGTAIVFGGPYLITLIYGGLNGK